MSKLVSSIIGFGYQNALRPILFTQDAELVHNRISLLGERLGSYPITQNITKTILAYEHPSLEQSVAGISFANPLGLSAGFDYNAQLTQILPHVGFGFATVGTITNLPYEGNPKPRLGRLPNSKSLLVNKGFKNEGADEVIKKLSKLSFEIPIGVSIGRSNSPKLKTLEQSIADIITSFEKFEKAKIKNAYYELNISCPNLIHGGKNITFYPPTNLEKLLTHTDKLKLSKPLFIKMPITESNSATIKMLDVVVKHNVAGVVIGNLQKDRKDPVLDKNEVENAGTGNFSGKPCWSRSNELISLTYQKYGDKLEIIGCGGVFTARDAYEKIKCGSSLIMLITGMIYEGPQLIGEINSGLVTLLKKDGYSTISQAVGAYY